MIIRYFLLLSFSLSYLLSQNSNCESEMSVFDRSIYSVGDTLSDSDQNILFPVCNGSGSYATGDSFTFADLNGVTNGGDYKLTIISMNATW